MKEFFKSITDAMFGPNNKIYCAVRDGEANTTRILEDAYYQPVENRNDLIDSAKEAAKSKAAISLIVNSGGSDRKDIRQINAHVAAAPVKNYIELMQAVDILPLKPSIVFCNDQLIVAVWFVFPVKSTVSDFSSIQKDLAVKLHSSLDFTSENAAIDINPVLSDDGEDVLVELIRFNPGNRYHQADIARMVCCDHNKTISTSGKPIKELGLNLVLHNCEFLHSTALHIETVSDRDFNFFVSIVSRFEGGYDLIHQLAAKRPGYSKIAVDQMIETASASFDNPITCSMICDNGGFSCPNYAFDNCNYSSPNELANQPLSIERLREYLSNIKPAGNQTDDDIAAQKFIRDYLFNQEMSIAEPFISGDLLKHFNLRSSSLALLKKVYKQVSAKWSKWKDYNSNLPPWYTHEKDALRFIPGVLAQHLADTENAVLIEGRNFLYTDGVYKFVDSRTIQRIIQIHLLVNDATSRQIEDVEKQWNLYHLLASDQINTDPYMINLKNGLFYVKDRTLQPHSPAIYSTIRLPVSYDPKADCPRFKQYLLEVMNGDEAQVKLIQEILGYLLVPVTSAQKFFVFCGQAGAGKSILLRVIREILIGDENGSSVSWQDLSRPFQVSALYNKLINVCADLPDKSLQDNGLVKGLVGEDKIQIEFKFQDAFDIKSVARLVFSCNKMPDNEGDLSDGFYRKLLIVPFTTKVPEEKCDHALFDKLVQESAGIFNFALDGLYRLMENDFVFSETDVNRNKLEEYRESNNSVIAFVKDRCNIDGCSFCKSRDLHDAYVEYCEQNGYNPFSVKKFISLVLDMDKKKLVRAKDPTGKFRGIRGINPYGDVFLKHIS